MRIQTWKRQYCMWVALCRLNVLLFLINIIMHTKFVCQHWYLLCYSGAHSRSLIYWFSVLQVHTFFFVYRGYPRCILEYIFGNCVCCISGGDAVCRTSRRISKYWMGVLLRMVLCCVAFSGLWFLFIFDFVGAGVGTCGLLHLLPSPSELFL
jgi:hypothetical protein